MQCIGRETPPFIRPPATLSPWCSGTSFVALRYQRGTREYSRSAAVLIGRKPAVHRTNSKAKQSKADLRHLCEQRDPLVIGEVVHRHQLQLLECAKDLRDDDDPQTNTPTNGRSDTELEPRHAGRPQISARAGGAVSATAAARHAATSKTQRRNGRRALLTGRR